MMIVGIGIKTYYSIQHAQAAAYFARQATSVEKSISDETGDEAVVLKAYVAGTLFSSVAFLEALANELFADAAQPDGGHLSSLPEAARAIMAELGETEAVQKAPVLSKFDLLLRGAGKVPLPKSEAPYQITSTLVRLIEVTGSGSLFFWWPSCSSQMLTKAPRILVSGTFFMDIFPLTTVAH